MKYTEQERELFKKASANGDITLSELTDNERGIVDGIKRKRHAHLTEKPLNQERAKNSGYSAEKRVQKLELAVCSLFGLLLGHILAPLFKFF